ncbi:hypothetical protein IAT38_005233 [Cryptococcus sp. DSM 104549]
MAKPTPSLLRSDPSTTRIGSTQRLAPERRLGAAGLPKGAAEAEGRHGMITAGKERGGETEEDDELDGDDDTSAPVLDRMLLHAPGNVQIRLGAGVKGGEKGGEQG